MFILCMERLAQAIMKEVNGGGSWNPIKLVRNGPNISHLFLADDLVSFAGALREQMVVIKKLLVELCQCLAHQDVADSPVWIWDNKPGFSVSSAYDILTVIGRVLERGTRLRGKAVWVSRGNGMNGLQNRRRAKQQVV
ncbi:hypothetical protein J1N35_040076 [Gossypium stocksii]|uniref:Uncharacterized protein n=1 Tax=Gossypium stocksii TaxID=47602 RepID=A0A9D3UDI1_9ROSI|nr:hypothetical protein J1N35_040076 [Gossypium stocksii]